MLYLDQVRNRYLRFYEKRGHSVMPSAPLVPNNDPTTLFTGSGMQPIVPYLLGLTHPLGTRLVDSQKCFRAEDADEVGDNRHTTFFEMLGNWSLGDYFKEDQLAWFFEFLTDDIGIPAERLYVTVFSGDPERNLPRDSASVALWKSLFKEKGIDAIDVDLGSVKQASERGMNGGRIFYYDTKKNWWSRSGPPEQMPAGEPGGPDSEVFYDFGTPHDPSFGPQCHPNCDCGRFMEIGNNVFMEYRKTDSGSFEKLPKRNVDFGGGLERIVAAANGDSDVFRTDVFKNLIDAIERGTGASYEKGDAGIKKSLRIIADHIRGATFMMADGVVPSNKERGYILRRLLRRAFFKASSLGSRDALWITDAVNSLVDDYDNFYPEIGSASDMIIAGMSEEARKFFGTIESGKRILEKELAVNPKGITGLRLFDFHQSHGFPFELSIEVLRERGVALLESDIALLKKEFDTANESHRTVSRSASDQKFKGGLGDTSDMSLRYHTATHLLHKALREVLGDHVSQRGSNITPERLRFDFSHTTKMTDDEKKRVEDIVNDAIQKQLPVQKVILPREEAEKSGALHFFADKYGDQVSVYYVGNTLSDAFSKEFCGGPHVTNTKELGSRFRIQKEEAVSAGVRRIKATLE